MAVPGLAAPNPGFLLQVTAAAAEHPVCQDGKYLASVRLSYIAWG